MLLCVQFCKLALIAGMKGGGVFIREDQGKSGSGSTIGKSGASVPM